MGLEEKVRAEMSNSNASSLLGIMIDFTFMISDLKMLYLFFLIGQIEIRGEQEYHSLSKGE